MGCVSEFLCLPNGFTGFLLQGDDAALCPARSHDDVFAVNDRGARVAPLGQAAAVIAGQIFLPNFFAVLPIVRGDFAELRNGENQTSRRVHGGRDPRAAGVAAAGRAGFANGFGPNAGTIPGVEAND